MKYSEFNVARKFVHTLGLKNQKEQVAFVRSGKKPKDIPAAPQKVYKNKAAFLMVYGKNNKFDYDHNDSASTSTEPIRGLSGINTLNK